MSKTFKKSHFVAICKTSSKEKEYLQLTMNKRIARNLVNGHKNHTKIVLEDIEKALAYIDDKG